MYKCVFGLSLHEACLPSFVPDVYHVNVFPGLAVNSWHASNCWHGHFVASCLLSEEAGQTVPYTVCLTSSGIAPQQEAQTGCLF